MPPSQFYLAIGRDPRRRDLHVCLAVGQKHYLVPAGTRGARLLRTIPGIRLVYDSGAWPPHNPDRLTLEQYAQIILEEHRIISEDGEHSPSAIVDWFAPYDHILSPERTAQDARRLRDMLPGEVYDDAVISLVQFPSGAAGDVIGELQYDMSILDDEERAALVVARRHGAVDGPVGRPACAVGGMVPARNSRELQRWYGRLLHELSSAVEVDEHHRTLHLFGVSRLTFVNHPLVASFDSSTPFRMAQFGWLNIERAFNPAYGYTAAKLKVSREARVAYFLTMMRDKHGLAWSRLDEATLLDDSPASLQRRQQRDQPKWRQTVMDDWLTPGEAMPQAMSLLGGGHLDRPNPGW